MGRERERWDFTDWGDHSQNLTPGSVVRLEGVSVNFWNDRRSININRPSRVTVLKEGGQPVTKISDEPVPISEAGEAEGIVSVVARVLSKKDDQIVKKDGSGTLDIVRVDWQILPVLSDSFHGENSTMRLVR